MRADEFLDEHGISYETVEQDNPTKTCDDAAEERGLEPSQIVKSLIVETDEGYVHCLVPGDRTLSEKKFRGYRMADPEKSEELTGFESGTVHPFSSDLERVVDERVFENDRVSFTTGDIYTGVILDASSLRQGLEELENDYSIEDLVVATEEDYGELESEGLDREQAAFVLEKGLRKVFFELLEGHDAEDAFTVLKKMVREECPADAEVAGRLLERAENETHLQKLAAHYASEGSLPDEDDGFDLETVVEKAVDDNPDAVEDYRLGKESALNYLLGQVMQETNGRADGGEVRELLLERLEQR
ncbi:MAG: YbaK/EbsC family protein [Candidatus Nanohaloarchaea archaeon]